MNKVNIFEVKRNANFHSSKNPRASQYRVKWRVQGRDKTRSFRTKTRAEHFHRKLLAALEAGDTFNSVTGLPSSWTQMHRTFAEIAQEYVREVWASHEDASKRSTVEALCYSLIYLTRKSNQHLDFSVMTKAAKFHILHPTPPNDPPSEVVQAKDWLLQNSLRLSEIDGNIIGELLLKLSKDKVGARTLKLATFRRRRQALYATFELAVKREYVKRNPLQLTLFKRPKLESAIDPAYFLSVAECRDYVSALDAQGVDGKRVGTFVSLLWLAGLRPGEALGLKKQDCKLEADEPRIEVRRNTVQVGKAWTVTGDAQITKSPKSRSFGHIRSVPIPSELTERLREHCKYLNSDSLLFASANDKRSLSLTVFEDAWVKVRKSKTRLYDLRHTNASILIYSGLNIIEVASRLGHSVNVCTRTYLHLLGGHSNNSDKKIEEFLRQSKPRAKGGHI